ncbi:iron-containing alcohol dehydrogenase family protein [Microbacterium aoyamense]|uniref:Iron-containing alcohol dehydrogenase family protein n=1 Tax=Microbacterium aoyamense TaxID=344166 RepID=A0ABN2PBK1_9MICO|nr:iron-containing alcohol dehydrogenase family protein [Microbacterium aoyamense]
MSVPFVRYSPPATRALWGDGALSELSRELDRMDLRRIVMVCSRSVAARDDVMAIVEGQLGARLVGTFTGVREHSPVPQVQAAAELLQTTEADGVVAIGGGSAVVTARAATILSAEGRGVRELATHRDATGRMVSPRLNAPKLPNIVLATTPTTAYAKAGAAVRDPETRERLALFDPKARAQLVVFDPALAATAPSRLVSSASLNVLSMAIDGMQSVADNPLAEALLAQGLREVIDHLPVVKDEGEDDLARIRLMLAALLIGQGSDSAGAGIAQALSHALGPMSDAANGTVEAMLLPHTATFNTDVTGASQRRIADVFAVDGQSPESLPALTARFLRSAGVPDRLRDVGIARDDLAVAVDHAFEDWSLTRVPKRPDRADLVGILDAAW